MGGAVQLAPSSIGADIAHLKPHLTSEPVRAAVLTADRGLAVADVPEPEPTTGHVVVAVERCGICGSDLHLRHSGWLPEGTVMGHEIGGRVAAIGPLATGLREGQRVSVYPSAPCRQCRTCLAGRHSICLNQGPTSIGLGANPGGYAEYVLAAATSCFPVPDDLSPELAALVEPYAVGLHAVRRSRATAGDPVGIVGAGPIGLTTLAALRAEGITDVVVAERSQRRAAAAAALGAVAVVHDASRIDSELGAQPEVVFDCAGVGAVPPLAAQLTRPGGQVVLVGVAGLDDPLALIGALLVIKEVDILAALGYTLDEFAEAITALASGALDQAVVVSDVRPLEDAAASFDELEQLGGPVKVMLAP